MWPNQSLVLGSAGSSPKMSPKMSPKNRASPSDKNIRDQQSSDSSDEPAQPQGSLGFIKSLFKKS